MYARFCVGSDDHPIIPALLEISVMEWTKGGFFRSDSLWCVKLRLADVVPRCVWQTLILFSVMEELPRLRRELVQTFKAVTTVTHLCVVFVTDQKFTSCSGCMPNRPYSASLTRHNSSGVVVFFGTRHEYDYRECMCHRSDVCGCQFCSSVQSWRGVLYYIRWNE